MSGSKRSGAGMGLGQAARACPGRGKLHVGTGCLALTPVPRKAAGLHRAMSLCLSVLLWPAELLRGEHQLLAMHTQPPQEHLL